MIKSAIYQKIIPIILCMKQFVFRIDSVNETIDGC